MSICIVGLVFILSIFTTILTLVPGNFTDIVYIVCNLEYFDIEVFFLSNVSFFLFFLFKYPIDRTTVLPWNVFWQHLFKIFS